MFINVQLMEINVLKKYAKRLSTYGAQECLKHHEREAQKILFFCSHCQLLFKLVTAAKGL